MNIRLHNMKKSLLVGAMALALTACFDESDDSNDDDTNKQLNNAPTISSTAETSVDQYSEYSYIIAADDTDGDDLTIEITTLPSWLTFDESTLTLSGTPGADDTGDHDVVVSVSDGTDTITQSFTITVNSVNRAPELTFSEVTGSQEGDMFEVTVTASDPDGDTLTLSADTLPSWLSFNADTGLISGTAGDNDSGSHEVSIAVFDGTVTVTESITINVADVVSQAPVALTIYEDAANPQWAAWDCCGGTTATIEDDGSSYGNVTEFTINGATVVGFTARDADGAVNGTTFNASNLTADGTLEFDLKLVNAPSGTPNWLLKVESDNNSSNGEVSLSSAIEGHSSPEVGVWQHYSFRLSDLETAGLDLSKIDLVMVFPAWGEGDGAVFRIDNVVIRGTGDTSNPDPGEEPTPTTGDLVIYEDVIQPNWLAWDCCAGSTPGTVFESDSRGEVTEFSIGGDTVVGYTTRAAHGATNGVVHDATSIVDTGTLSFDLKMTSSPGDTNWMLKVESNGGTNFAEVNLNTAQEGHAGPVLDTWQTYTFNLKDLQTAGLDVSSIDIVMIFPAWGTGAGAVYRVDNVKINSSGATMSTKPSLPLDFENTNFTYVLTDFGGAASELVADPDSANARGTVAKTIKTNTAETWAGTTTSGNDGLAEPVALSAEKTVMKLWVYSPAVGVTVRLKLEDAADNTATVETDSVTTMANTWELMSFDFANHADGTQALNLDYTFDKASVFFNFGVSGADAGELTFYWDGLMLEE